MIIYRGLGFITLIILFGVFLLLDLIFGEVPYVTGFG